MAKHTTSTCDFCGRELKVGSGDPQARGFTARFHSEGRSIGVNSGDGVSTEIDLCGGCVEGMMLGVGYAFNRETFEAKPVVLSETVPFVVADAEAEKLLPEPETSHPPRVAIAHSEQRTRLRSMAEKVRQNRQAHAERNAASKAAEPTPKAAEPAAEVEAPKPSRREEVQQAARKAAAERAAARAAEETPEAPVPSVEAHAEPFSEFKSEESVAVEAEEPSDLAVPVEKSAEAVEGMSE